MSDIRVTFVISDGMQDESDASDIMIQAYDSCKQLVSNISWMKEADLSTKTFSKLDYLVFENFDGKDFSKFINNKCAVLGPLAISVCLIEGKPIPNFQWPIQNVAMYGCEVTCSQLSKTNKEAIKNNVQLMGGFYTGNLTESTTHLICDGTKSEKYMLAAEKGLKLMLPSWISHVYKLSQNSNFSANDPKILAQFKCLPFHKLIICATGITTTKERAKLSSLIADNGGTLVGKLSLSNTDVLICHGPGGTTSEKYKAAVKTSHISCVTEDWIFDSIKKGHALPRENYKVKTSTSTPTKEGENIDPNFSTISAIGRPVSLQKTHINETVDVTQMQPIKRVGNKRKADAELVEKIDIKKVKNAGNFLDGCSVFVAGFNPAQRDKLNRIINLSGATRYDDFSERVSHVIIGDSTATEIRKIKSMAASCCLVSVQWLLDSVEQQKPAEEEAYIIADSSISKDLDKSSLSSPLSKKILNLVREETISDADNTTMAKTVTNTPDCNEEDDLAKRYLQNAQKTNQEEEDTLAKLLENKNYPTTNPNEEEFTLKTRPLSRKNDLENANQSMDFRPHETSTQISQVTTDMSDNDLDVLPIFKSLKFILDGFDKEIADSYKTHIVAASGTILDKRFKGVSDYAVLPVVGKVNKLPPVQEIVNDLWLLQCLENKQFFAELQYYHRPIELPDTSPLLGCVITISGYTGEERQFLRNVIEGLNGTFQELFSRKTNEVKHVIASTHLVTPEASGKKYEAALKWNLPAITKDWLLECAKTGEKVAVENFLVGEINSPENSNPIETPCRKDMSVSPNREKTNATIPKIMENEACRTPVNQIYHRNDKDTPAACSQVTPINKIVQDAIDNKVLPTPPSPETRFPWDIKTPDTPLGAFIRDPPSPALRKEMQRYVNSFPDWVPPKRRLSTPLSELKRRLMDKVLGRGAYSQASQTEKPKEVGQDTAETTENLVAHQKLQELHQRVMASGSSSTTKRSSCVYETTSNVPGIEKANVDAQSQICTVGWDYGEDKTQTQQQKIFMLSGIPGPDREELANNLRKLGAVVSELPNYDVSATHLICPHPGKNEKTLACMAAGKWILHTSYVEKSVAAGQFLNEETFEFGNPKASSNIFYEQKDSPVHYWREEIARRGYGAFNDMRAIVIARVPEPITKVIEAGGGVVVNVEPPFDDSIHATHCLLEIKMIKDFSKYVPLAQQGIKCVNTIYIKDFLWRIKSDFDFDYVIPYFAKYYK